MLNMFDQTTYADRIACQESVITSFLRRLSSGFVSRVSAVDLVRKNLKLKKPCGRTAKH